MTYVPIVHTVEPLVPLSDDEIAFWAGLPSWTLIEALFLLSGHKPPCYESAFRHIQDHFWLAYTHARLAIRQGDLCQKTVEAGKAVFYDRPAHWLAWADRIGPERIKVDERMCQALSQTADNPDGSVKEKPRDERPELKQEVEPQEKPQATPEAQTAQGSEPLSENQRDLKNRAQAILKEGQRIRGRNKTLSIRVIASRMARNADDGKIEGWGEDTLRKILAGRYEPVSRLGLKGLDQG